MYVIVQHEQGLGTFIIGWQPYVAGMIVLNKHVENILDSIHEEVTEAIRDAADNPTPPEWAWG